MNVLEPSDNEFDFTYSTNSDSSSSDFQVTRNNSYLTLQNANKNVSLLKVVLIRVLKLVFV